MAAVGTVIAEWWASIGAAEVGAGVAAEGAASAGAAGVAAEAGGAVAAGAGATGAGVAGGAAAAGASSGLWSTIGNAALQAGVGYAASSLLAPGRPKIVGATPMADPAGQEEARRRSVTEQLARRGRASTIMTQPPGGKLGG